MTLHVVETLTLGERLVVTWPLIPLLALMEETSVFGKNGRFPQAQLVHYRLP